MGERHTYGYSLPAPWRPGEDQLEDTLQKSSNACGRRPRPGQLPARAPPRSRAPTADRSPIRSRPWWLSSRRGCDHAARPHVTLTDGTSRVRPGPPSATTAARPLRAHFESIRSQTQPAYARIRSDELAVRRSAEAERWRAAAAARRRRTPSSARSEGSSPRSRPFRRSRAGPLPGPVRSRT